MKITFIGDIHGKVNAVEKALALEGRKIFVGDFIDSWNRSPEDHDKCLKLVLEAIEQKEPVEAIYGNHELSYIIPQHRCSGYKYIHEQIMNRYKERIKQAFKPFILLDKDFLVSHAGLTKDLWDNESLTFENLSETLNKWWEDPYSPMHWIGMARGGRSYYGGLFWCDFEREFKHVPGLTQVFGHTRGNITRVIEEGEHASFCIDNLDSKLEFLNWELE
jgi:hypothetical protein